MSRVGYFYEFSFEFQCALLCPVSLLFYYIIIILSYYHSSITSLSLALPLIILILLYILLQVYLIFLNNILFYMDFMCWIKNMCVWIICMLWCHMNIVSVYYNYNLLLITIFEWTWNAMPYKIILQSASLFTMIQIIKWNS